MSASSSVDVPNEVISAAALVRVVRAIIERAGSLPAEADLVAHNLVLANLVGHDSHGVGMLPRYVDALSQGGLRVNEHVAIELDTGVLLRLDGRSGFGQVVGREAMALGVERALAHGVCVIALGRAHHLGRIGHWAEQCLEHGLISIHFVNVVARPIVAPFGGLDARAGTNPICIGIPRPGHTPLVLDFATSRIAQGKARLSYHRGEAVPPGMLLDAAGEASTDPRHVVVPPFGALLPFGEHKGFGLNLVAELLGGALTGGGTGRHAYSGNRAIHNGMLSIVIDPDRLETPGYFAAELEAYVAWLKQARVAAEAAPVKLAGELERETHAIRLATGIPIDLASWREIVEAARSLGLEPAELEALAAD